MNSKDYLLFVSAIVIFLFFPFLPVTGQRPGIECGCTEYGYYKTPSTTAFSVFAGASLEEGFSSKDKKYRLIVVDVAAPNEVNITIYYEGKLIFNENTRATGWGFSPDEDRFVMHGIDYSGNHFCRLANLNPQGGVEGEPAIVETLVQTSVGSSVIRFSPNGKYLLYAGIDHNGMLVLNVFDAADFRLAYDASGTRMMGNIEDKVATGGWGFSPDKKNETFLLSYITDIDKYNLFVKNLRSPAGEYVAEYRDLQGQSYWAFSPCGDYFAWLHGSVSESPVCRFYKTSEVQTVFRESAGGGVRKFSAYPDGHYVVYNFLNDSTHIFDNTSGETCPDKTRPTWAADASLDTLNVKGPSMQLTWNGAVDNIEVTNYRIYQYEKMVKEIDNSTQCEIKSLKPDTVYTFKVEAGDEAGNWSTTGPQLTQRTKTDSKPSWINGNLTISHMTETKLRLNWSGAKDDYGIEYFHIYKNGELIDKVGGEEESWSITGLKPDSSYIFKIEAEDGAMQMSVNGPVKEQIMPVAEKPWWNIPGDALTASEITETTMKLSWPFANDQFNEVRGYKVFRDKELISGTTRFVNEVYVTELEEGKIYLFEIIARDESGNESDPLSAELSSLPPFVVEPLITHPADQVKPDICDSIVVWCDKRNDDGDIYMYNLETGVETHLTDNPAVQFDPRVNGDRVVWTDTRNGSWDIYMYDPENGERPVCTASGAQDLPVIDGDIIVWRDSRNGNWDIFMLDLTTMQESPVCTRSSNQNWPDISRGYIVYADDRNGNWDIYMYNISTKKEQVICKRGGDQTNPSISKGKYHSDLGVSYVDGNDLYVYYPFYGSSPGYEYAVPVDVGIFISRQQNPHMRDMQLVFEDNLGGDGSTWHIYAFDFKMPAYGRKIPVCVDPLADHRNPRTSRKNIVWEDNRNGNKDIYIWKRPPGSDLELVVKDFPDPVGIGDTLRYILSLTNNGPKINTNLRTVCTLPFQAKYIKAMAEAGTVKEQGLTLIWEVPVLRSDSSISLEIVLQTAEPAKLCFEAVTSGEGFETNPSNNSVKEFTMVKEIIPGIIGEGSYSAILAEPGGKVHISYIGNNSLEYASRVPKGKWEHISLGNCFECRENAMIIDSGKNIHIIASDFFWDEEPKSRLYHIILNDPENWSKKIIALSDSGFSNLTLQYGNDHELYLAYQQAASGTANPGPLKYMKTTGMRWGEEKFLDQNCYDHIGFALDKNNTMHLSYYDLMRGGLSYQRKTSESDARPDLIELVEPEWKGGQMEGMTTSLDLDSLEVPHIAYAGSMDKDYREHLKYAWLKDGIWNNKMIDPGTFASTGSKMKLGHKDYANFAYHHHLSGELRTAVDISGFIPKQTILENLWGWDIDMDMDDLDNKHICFSMDGKIHYVKVPFPDYFMYNPDTLNFGFVPGNSSETLILRITNPLEKILSIDSMVCPDARVSPGKTSFTLSRDQSDTLAVTFNQTDNTSANTYIRVYYNSTSGLFMDIPVIARSFAPKLTVSHDPLDFGLVPLYTEETRIVTVKNEGVMNLDISNVSVVFKIGSFIIPTDFSLKEHTCTSLAPGDSCQITIGFKPMKDAGYSGHYSYLNIQSNDPDKPYMQIALKGDIPKPALKINKNIDFGYREMNQTYHDTITLFNIGTKDLTINYLTLSGTNPNQFSYLNPCSTIPPGDSCKVPVSFTPLLSGDLNATIYVNSNFSLTPSFPVQLKGTTLFRKLGVSPDTLHFGDINTGESVSRAIQLFNPGENPVTIEHMQIAGPDRIEFRVIPQCSVIPAGMSCTDTIAFFGFMEGYKTAYLLVLSNDTENPVQTIYLDGSAGAGPPLQAAVTADPETGTDPLIVIFTSTVSGGQPPYNYEWDFDDGSTASDSNPVHEFCCPGAYLISVKVSDALIQSDTKQIKVIVGATGVPSAGIFANLSAGSVPLKVDFSATVVGGDGPISFSWDFGDGNTSQDANPVHTFITEGTFTVWLTVTDEDGDMGYDQMLIRAEEENFNLSGNITDHSGSSAVDKSVVQLYRENYENLFATLTLDQEHVYSFKEVKTGLYTVKVNPDAIIYPDKLPTYLGNVITMADASWITLDEDLTGKDIRVVTIPPDMGGEGVIAGQLVEESSGKKLQVYLKKAQTGGDPVPGCYVYLKDAFDHILKAFDVTDQQGLFLFDKLPDGDYLFLADYQGKPMDSNNKPLTINSLNKDIEILAIVGTEMITVEDSPTGIEENTHPEIRIYPVPANDKILIFIPEGLFKDSSVRMKITDLSGKYTYLTDHFGYSGNPITVDINSLNNGLYMLEVTGKEISQRVKIVKVR